MSEVMAVLCRLWYIALATLLIFWCSNVLLCDSQLWPSCSQHSPPTQIMLEPSRTGARRNRREESAGQDEPPHPTLLEQALAGDTQAFGALFEQTRAMLTAYLIRLGAPPSEHDDLVQEVFAKAWAARAQLHHRRAFSSWLLTIARRCWIDLLRSRHVEQRTLQRWLSDYLHDCETVNPLGEDVDLLLRAFDTLRPADREILLLRFGEDLPLQEVASLLGISPAAAQRRAHRALNRLRDTFSRLKHSVES